MYRCRCLRDRRDDLEGLGGQRAAPGPPRSTTRPPRRAPRRARACRAPALRSRRAAPPRRRGLGSATKRASSGPAAATSRPRSASSSARRFARPVERWWTASQPKPSSSPIDSAHHAAAGPDTPAIEARWRSGGAPTRRDGAGSASEPISRRRRGQLLQQVPAHVQAAGPLRSTEPLLARGRIEVASEGADIGGDGAEALGAVKQHLRDDPRAPGVHHLAAHPGHVRAGHQPGRGPDRARRSSANGAKRTSMPARRRAAASGARIPGCSSSLVSTSSPSPQVERGQHVRHAVRGGARERNFVGAAAERGRQAGTEALDPPRQDCRSGRARRVPARPARALAAAASAERRGTGPLVPVLRYASPLENGELGAQCRRVHGRGRKISCGR